MCRLGFQFGAMLMFAGLALTISGCGNRSAEPPATVSVPTTISATVLEPKTGDQCNVHFRRDFLGANLPSPIPIVTDNHNGAQITLSGVFEKMNADWLVIKTGDKTHEWIPKNSILHVTVSSP